MTAIDRATAPAISAGRPGNATTYALSPQQKRIRALGHGHPGLVAQAAVAIGGLLDAGRLEHAAQRLVDRHEILRTTFPDGPARQRVAGHATPSWRLIEARGRTLVRLLAEERRVPFDLRAGPVLRLALARLGGRDHALLVTLPAVCADPQSIALLVEELAAEYGGDPPVAEPLQYGDLVAWLNEPYDDGADRVGRDLWRGHASLGALDPRITLIEASSSRSFDPAYATVTLEARAAGAIDALAADCGSSAESVLAVCWHALLARLASGTPVAVGMLCDGRLYPELADAVGPLARYLPLRCALDQHERFTAALRRFDAALTDARDWQECFSWDLCPDGAPPAIPACFEIVDYPPPRTADGCTFTVAARYGAVDRFWVRLGCGRRSDELVLELHHDTTALDAAAAQHILAQTARLASEVAAAPHAPLGSLRSLGSAEERLLVEEFNAAATATPADDRWVHELIADHARRAPGNIALALRSGHTTYAELDARSNRLAHALVRRGIGPENRVGVCLERSPDLVVGLLGVLKAGAAYVPLDPSYPAARVAFMVRDAGVSAVVTRDTLQALVPPGDWHVVVVDRDHTTIDAERSDAPAVAIHPANLAYVIYTSGSTGTPKGAMITHRAFANYVRWCAHAYSIPAGSGAPVHSPIGFDLTVTALYGPLVAGRTCVLVPEDEGLDGLAAVLRAGHDFSLVKLTPSQLDVLSQLIPAAEAAGCTRNFVLGGEPLTEASLKFWRKHAPDTRIVNEYGPTEASVGCIVHHAEPGAVHGQRVPIGRPIPGLSAYVLDEYRNPVPAGVPGALYVGGVGIARGYLDRPGLTAERFLPDPFASVPGARLYSTGDRVRHVRGGGLEFLDRIDRQVKIRGFRVEPEEVERVLAEHDSVERAVAVVRDGPAGPRLVAYCARRHDAALTHEDLDAFLAARLPVFMLPTEVLVLDSLPLTANGKTDAAALPFAASVRRRYMAPRTRIEQVLAVIWSDILGKDRIGVHDNFFELGGQSMSAARLVFLIRDGLQADMPLRTVFEAPTIASMAAALAPDGASAARAEAAARVMMEVADLSEDEVTSALAARHHRRPG